MAYKNDSHIDSGDHTGTGYVQAQSVKALSIDLKPVEQFFDTEVKLWNTEHPAQGGWAILSGKVPLNEVVRFLIESTDEFVVMVGGMVGSTGDVKTIVLDLIGKLYDVIIAGVLPIWIRPFSGTIKYIIINVILANLMDYLIKQYKTGARVAMTLEHGEVVHMMSWKAQ
jgi:hypothetical protein